MKLQTLPLLLALAASVAAQEPAADPTSASGSIADSLRAQIAEFHALGMKALVVGSGENAGVALLSVHAVQEPDRSALVRAGTTLAVPFNGIPVTLRILAVDPEGVRIEAPTLEDALVVPGGLRALPAPSSPPEGAYLRHVECTDIPVGDLLRLIADQTGANIAASDEAAKLPATLALRNVTPEHAVAELCRSRGLWFRRDSDTGILRVTTMAEYETGLSSLSEQVSECFTLLYPNVVEAASILYGLYPDRVLLSMGEDDILDSELNDLDRRIERFNAIGGGQSTALLSKAPGSLSATGGGRSATGFKTGVTEVRDLRDDLNDARRAAPKLSSEDAAHALSASGGESSAADALLQARRASSGIYVTVSRRNNLLLVRTSDLGAMEEIRELIRRIDVPTPMVLLEMKILNVSVGDGYDADFLWSFQEEDSHGHAKSVAAVYPSQTSFETILKNEAMNFTLVGRRFAANLQWLESQNRVTVVATPTLLVANNELSRIFRGQNRPLVKDISATATTTDNGVTTTAYDTQIEWSDVGTMIVVTPSINADRSVTLRLMHEESTVDAEKARIPISTSNADGGLEYAEVDVLDSRSISGTFVAQDGVPIAVGGLISESTEKVVRRVPFLGRIPLLGFLFRSTELVKNRSELVILITPHVISTPADGAAISAGVLERISKAQSVIDKAQSEEDAAHKIDNAILLPTAPQEFDGAAPVDLQAE